MTAVPEHTIPTVRVANKAQAAEFFGISLPGFENWVRRGCPIVQKGSRGVPWIFDLLEVAKWRFLSSGASQEEVPPEKMLPSDRKAWYESEKKRRELQVMDRELIPVEEVERVVATAFAAISSDIRSLPDQLERRYALQGDIIEKVEEGLYLAMDGLADRLAELGPVDSEEGEE
jgi:phage terminase Nu1 subunit (DNA packaging protein)